MEDYYDRKLSRSGDNMRAFFWCFICIILLIIAAFFTSCKTVQYVPVPEYHHDSIYITNVQHDSVFQHDSVYIKEYTKGDTVFLEKTKWQTKYREKLVYDTTYVERVDSVSVPYPVERKLSRWEQLKIDWGGEAILVLFLCLAILVYLIIVRMRR